MIKIRKPFAGKSDNYNTCITLMLLVILFYTSYRYPFKINSTETSPTYSDTPAVLQVIKYGIFAVIFAGVTFYRVAQKKMPKVDNAILFGMYCLLFFVPIFYAALMRNQYPFSVGFFFLIPIMIQIYYGDCQVDFRGFATVVSRCILVFVLVDIIQVILFATTGRLPALAYEGTFSIRFGSVLDDPNAFGTLLSFFIGFSFYMFRGFKRVLVTFLLVICLALTQSATALVIVPFSLVLVQFLKIKTEYRTSAIILSLILVAAVLFFLNMDFFDHFIQQKQLSASEHGESLDILLGSTLPMKLGMDPIDVTAESGIINLACTMGVIYLAFFLAAGAWSCYELGLLLFAKLENHQRAVIFGMLCFLVSFYISFISLPLEKVFPVNALAYLVMGMTTSGTLRRGILSEEARCQ